MSKNLIGRNFGAYWIKQKLGHGGMASVFEAAHKETGQNVAIKVLHEHLNDHQNIRKRFEHEAKIASKLEHPNIVPIWDYGEFNNRVYLVMPLMQGGNFANALAKAGELHHHASLEILALLADALDYAHSRGVVHRDFKLENILLNEKNVPAISDFGIAKSAESQQVTMTGQILGSPQYIAPESFSNAMPSDYRQDLYAFAVSAYLMITGYFPFTGQGAMKVIEMHRNSLAPNPSEINPSLPTMLDDVFAKALAKDPDRRFPSAREFVYALDAAFLNVVDGVAKIHLDAENPVMPLSTTLFGAALMPNLTAAINLNAISKSETIDARVPLPAYENPQKKKRNRFVVPVLFVCLAIVGAVIAFAAERSFARLDVVTTLDAYERVLLTETSTATPSPTGTISPSPSPSPTETLAVTSTVEATSSPTLSITATSFSFYFGTPATKASAVSTTGAAVTGGASVGNGNGNSGGGNNTQVPNPTSTAVATLVPATNTVVPSPIQATNTVVAATVPPQPTNPPAPTDAPLPTVPPPTVVLPSLIPPTNPPAPTEPPPTEEEGNGNSNGNGNGNGNGRGDG